jgi:tRNA splicing endonuclease
MILTNGLFTFARFSNSKKDTIIANWYDNETEKYQEITIQTNLEDRLYRQLLETFSIDEIATMTDQKAKEQAAAFETICKDIAQKYNLVYDPSKATPQQSLDLTQLFAPPEGERGADLLFNIKLNVFDLPQVSDSDDAALKKRLREAKTPLEALYIAGKFLYE